MIRVRLLINNLLLFLYTICITSHIYFPYLPTLQVNQTALDPNICPQYQNATYYNYDPEVPMGFKISFYLGLGLGALSAGLLTTKFGSDYVRILFVRGLIGSGFVLSVVVEDQVEWINTMLWSLVALFSMGSFTMGKLKVFNLIILKNPLLVVQNRGLKTMHIQHTLYT